MLSALTKYDEAVVGEIIHSGEEFLIQGCPGPQWFPVLEKPYEKPLSPERIHPEKTQGEKL